MNVHVPLALAAGCVGRISMTNKIVFERIIMKNNLLVTQHKCHIKAYSRPDTGDAFTNCLQRITAEIASKQTLGQHAELRGNRILVAEDEKFLRILVRSVLRGAGYTIIEAIDGEDAILKFRTAEDGIDLLLLDVDMLKKNRRKVYDEIMQISPDIKVLFTSAYPVGLMQKHGIIEEGSPFLLKPFTPPLLLRKIREVLDS
jgi:CheY-like chemotaxis protein